MIFFTNHNHINYYTILYYNYLKVNLIFYNQFEPFKDVTFENYKVVTKGFI